MAKATCSVIEHGSQCTRPAEAHGLCTMHYKRLRKWGDPLFVQKRIRVPDPYAGTPLKTCLNCGEVKERATGFAVTPKGHDGLKTICRVCVRQHNRDRYNTDPAVRAAVARNSKKNLYGLTPENIATLSEIQGGGCAICSGPPDNRGWRVDHDHTCCPGTKTCRACVRGLLCHRCNVLVGHALDSIDRLQAAIAYLQDPPLNRLREQQKETN